MPHHEERTRLRDQVDNVRGMKRNLPKRPEDQGQRLALCSDVLSSESGGFSGGGSNGDGSSGDDSSGGGSSGDSSSDGGPSGGGPISDGFSSDGSSSGGSVLVAILIRMESCGFCDVVCLWAWAL